MRTGFFRRANKLNLQFVLAADFGYFKSMGVTELND